MSKKSGKYWVFAFNSFYPFGGMEDFCFSFDTIEEYEKRIIENISYDKYQLLNTENNYHFEGDLDTVTKWVCKHIGGEKYDEFS